MASNIPNDKMAAKSSFVLSDKSTAQKVDLPVMSGSLGPSVIDIRSLYAKTGNFTYDPGFTSTGSCESKITYIDGDQGVLLHRGYPIDQLAENSDFLEVSYLLLYGELPTPAQKRDFDATITQHTMVQEPVSYTHLTLPTKA